MQNTNEISGIPAADDRPTAEAVPGRQPEPGHDEAGVMAWIYEEIERRGVTPADPTAWAALIKEFAAQFPAFADRIRMGLELVLVTFNAARGSSPESCAAEPSGELTREANSPPSGAPLPDRIGDYFVERELGRGGNGQVFLARQGPPCCRQVALKLYHAPLRSSEERNHFGREVEALAALDEKDGFVKVYTYGVHNDRPFLVLEYLPGGSLKDVLDGRGPDRRLDPALAVPLVRKVAAAMHKAHSTGLRVIIHRDLKPANVLLTEGGEPKVNDFGLAKLTGRPGESSDAWVVGTLSYMPPEQVRAEPATPLNDIYGLGTVLYECLTGRAPYPVSGGRAERGQVGVQKEIVDLAVVPPSPHVLFPTTVPADLAAVCLKCLEKEPADRYPSMKELEDDLGRVERGEPTDARPVGRTEKFRRWVRRKPDRAALYGGTVVAVLSGVVIALVLNSIANDRAQEQQVARLEAAGQEAERERLQKEADYKANRLREEQRHSAEVEDLTADSFILPLPLERESRVTWGERDSLWGVAVLSPNQDAVRFKVLPRALRAEKGARRVANRPEELIQSVVGLDRERAGRLRDALVPVLTNTQEPDGVRLAAVRLALTLDLWDPEFAALTARAIVDLLPNMSREAETLLAEYGERLAVRMDATGKADLVARLFQYASSGRMPINGLSKEDLMKQVGYSLAVLAGGLDEVHAGGLMDGAILAVHQTRDGDRLDAIGKCLAALATRVPAGRVPPLANSIVADVDRVPDLKQCRALATGLPPLAGRMSPVEAVAFLGTLRRATELSSSHARDQVDVLLAIQENCIAAVAERLPGEMAAELARKQIRRICQTKGKERLSFMGGVFTRLAGQVNAVDATELAAQIMNIFGNEAEWRHTDDYLVKWERYEALARGLVVLVERIPAGRVPGLAAALVPVCEHNAEFRGWRWCDELFEVIAGRLTHDQVRTLARDIVAVIDRCSHPDRLASLAGYYLVVERRFGDWGASAFAFTFSKAIVRAAGHEKARIYISSDSLAKCIATQTKWLSSAEAKAIALELLQVRGRHPDDGVWRALEALVGRLNNGDAVLVARRLRELISRGSIGKDKGEKLDGFVGALAVRVDEGEATLLAVAIIEAIDRQNKDTKDLEAFDVLPDCLLALVTHRVVRAEVSAIGLLSTRGDGSGAVLAGVGARFQDPKLTRLLVEVCVRDWRQISQFCQSWRDNRSGEPTDIQTAEMFARLIRVATLFDYLRVVEGRPDCLPAFRDAAKCTQAHILDLCRAAPDPCMFMLVEDRVLDHALRLLLDYYSDADVAEMSRALAGAAERTRDKGRLTILGACLAVLAGRLAPAEASELTEALFRVMERAWHDRGIFEALAPVLAALWEKNNSLAAAAVGRLLRLIEGTSDGHKLFWYGRLFQTAVARLTCEQVNGIVFPQAEEILLKIHKRGTAAQEGSVLAGLTAITDRLDASALEKAVSWLLEAGATGNDAVLNGVKAAAVRLDLETTVRLLKHPLCVGQSRQLLMARVEHEAEQSFTTQWEMIAWLQRNHPEIDLRTAPIRFPH